MTPSADRIRQVRQRRISRSLARCEPSLGRQETRRHPAAPRELTVSSGSAQRRSMIAGATPDPVVRAARTSRRGRQAPIPTMRASMPGCCVFMSPECGADGYRSAVRTVPRVERGRPRGLPGAHTRAPTPAAPAGATLACDAWHATVDQWASRSLVPKASARTRKAGKAPSNDRPSLRLQNSGGAGSVVLALIDFALNPVVPGLTSADPCVEWRELYPPYRFATAAKTMANRKSDLEFQCPSHEITVHFQLGCRARLRPPALVPPPADPPGDPWRNPRSLPHPGTRTHLLATPGPFTARSSLTAAMPPPRSARPSAPARTACAGHRSSRGPRPTRLGPKRPTRCRPSP